VTRPLTYVELFAGAGGLSLGLDRAGWHCVAHAEIEPHARAVLRRHWPDTPLYGDVAALDGTQFRGVTLLSGGSPCQDLSIAGKREGLSGRRSGLFHHQVRIWRESEAPLLLWENVVGALSSNQGKDFARILSTITGAPVAVPRDGRRRRLKWANAGFIQGTRGVALAWRVLNLREFGIPQRRRRVFILASRTSRVNPREVLLDAESVRGHSQARTEARQVDSRAAAVVAQGGGAIGFDAYNLAITGDVIATISGAASDVNHTHGVLQDAGIKCLTPWEPQSARIYDASGGAPAITACYGQNRQAVFDAVVKCLTPWAPQSARIYDASGDAPTLSANGGKAGQNRQAVFDAYAIAINAAQPHPRPRRLMPVECERLMHWPDGWTADGIDEKGRSYACADTPRYKLVGNGVGSPVAEWIGRRIALHIKEAS
jgi:DNA (cytosine-5)-methyltransferase 1